MVKDSKSFSPLHNAAENDQMKIAEILLADGAEVEALNETGQTPLHCAARSGHINICRLLAKNEAVLENYTEDRCTPSWLAVEIQRLQVAEFFVQMGAGAISRNAEQGTPLYISASRAGDDMLKLFLNQGLNIEARDNLGVTLLGWLASAGQVGSATFLLTQGAHGDAVSERHQQTSLHLAA